MTDSQKFADSAGFKIFVPIMQALIGSAIIGSVAVTYNIASSIQAQLATQNINGAILTQTVHYIQTANDAQEIRINANTLTLQDHGYRLRAIDEYLKERATATRPRS